MSRGAKHEGATKVNAQGRPKGDNAAAKPSTIAMTAKAIAWSFFGVRKRRDHEHASVRINPIHVIVAGFVGVFVFVIGLMVLVRWIAA